MGFLDMDFNDVVAPTVAEPETEHKLRILSVKEGTDKNGNAYLMPKLEIPSVVGAKDFNYFIGLPHGGMDAKQLNSAKYKLKTFMDAFGIEYSSEVSDWPGHEGWAILGVDQDEQYGEQNFVKRFVKA